MPAKLCRHIKPDGNPCRAVALAGRPCCLAHQRLRQRIRRQQRPPRTPTIRLGPLQDRRAISRAISRVVRAIAHDTLNPDRSASLLEHIRKASTALNRPGSCQPTAHSS